MSADNRSVSTDTLATLGTIIDDTQKRDAIHLAVIPMVARYPMLPGAHIDREANVCAAGDGVGIVDPFLRQNVLTGERFWCVIYPRVITSLRHVWAHPQFDDEDTLTSAPSKSESEQWLRDFISKADCPDYDTVIALASGQAIPNPFPEDYGSSGGYIDGEYLHFSGTDAHGEIPPEFWMHLEVVTGKTLTQRPSYFSCSC